VLDKDWFVEQTRFVDDLFDRASLHQRSIRTLIEDGLLELHFGLTGILITAGFLAVPFEPRLGSVRYLGVSFFQIALAVLMLLANKKIKATYVFPRTGCVIFRQAQSDGWVQTLIAAGALLAFTALLLLSDIYFPKLWDFCGPISALVIAGGLVWGGRFLRLPHLNWLSGFTLLLGLATYVAGPRISGLWTMLGISAALAVSGAARFRVFLKTHPKVEDCHG
jgi:hypothetical protein